MIIPFKLDYLNSWKIRGGNLICLQCTYQSAYTRTIAVRRLRQRSVFAIGAAAASVSRAAAVAPGDDTEVAITLSAVPLQIILCLASELLRFLFHICRRLHWSNKAYCFYTTNKSNHTHKDKISTLFLIGVFDEYANKVNDEVWT